MSASTQRTKTDELSLTRTLLGLLRHYVAGRWALIALALAAAIGLYSSWGWLAAVGVAPILVAIAPCATMCALGLCASKLGGKSCSADTTSRPGATSPSHALEDLEDARQR